MNEAPRDIGLMGEIVRNFVCLIILVGLVIGAIVYQVLGSILREQHNQRAALITINLTDAATGPVVSKDVLQLKTLVTKYARLSGVAYAFIKDREGTVIAHSSATFSPELQGPLHSDQRREVGQRILTFQGKSIYETRGPILEGQLGTAHLGIWADAIEQQVYQALSMLWPIALVLVAAVIVAVFLARRLIQPFRRLTDIAGRISAGDLDTPVRVQSQEGFGELTRSLERMRASLKAAMVRLNGDANIAKVKGGKDEQATVQTKSSLFL
jgi:nitrogen fixation/metabolism regulation signal transduction histidine kinase